MYRSLYMTEVKDVSNNANNVQQPQVDSTDKEEISKI